MYQYPRRIIFVFGILATLLGLISFVARHDIAESFGFDYRYVFIFAIITFLYGVAVFLYFYLRGGLFIRSHEESLMREELSFLRNELKNGGNDSFEIDKIKNEISKLQETINKKISREVNLSEDEKLALFLTIKDSATKDITNEFIQDIEKKYSPIIHKSKQIEHIIARTEETKKRLVREIDALGRRGAINLIIGVITTVVAVGLLATTVITPEAKIDSNTLISYFLPRVTLSIFIEVFSFFFLKLYKTGLSEIKYFQNELTNIESWFVSLEASIISGDIESTKSILIQLSNIERNFILKKGDSTVELEKVKNDNNNTKEILSSIVSILKKTK